MFAWERVSPTWSRVAWVARPRTVCSISSRARVAAEVSACGSATLTSTRGLHARCQRLGQLRQVGTSSCAAGLLTLRCRAVHARGGNPSAARWPSKAGRVGPRSHLPKSTRRRRRSGRSPGPSPRSRHARARGPVGGWRSKRASRSSLVQFLAPLRVGIAMSASVFLSSLRDGVHDGAPVCADLEAGSLPPQGVKHLARQGGARESVRTREPVDVTA